MKFIILTLMALLGVLSLVNAVDVLEKVENPKVLRFELEKRDALSASQSSLMSGFNDMYYSFSFALGTPSQQIQAVFDTGSSDLVVNIWTSDKCSKTPQSCLNGLYIPSISNTKKPVSDGMMAQYSVVKCSGSWVKDVLHIGGSNILGFEFGICNVSTSPMNYWGFGYSSSSGGSDQSTLETLAASNLIKSASVSFQLAEPASFILGGLDTNAYTGTLIGFSIVPNKQGQYDSLALRVVGVFLNGMALYTSGYPLRAILNTGTFDNKFPSDMAQQLWDNYATSYITLPGDLGTSNNSFALCDCGLSRNTEILKVDFHGFYIELPVGDLVQQVPGALLEALNITIPQGQCILNVNVVKGDSPVVLGSSILKHVYVVFDAESNTVALGKLSVSAGLNPSIKEIGPGASGLSNAVPYMILESDPIGSTHTTAAGSNLVPGWIGCLVAMVMIFMLAL